VPALAWWAAVPVGALSTAVLVVNNLRDRHTDAVCGKRTLAVRLGRGGALTEYALLLVAAYAVPAVLAATGRAGMYVLLPFATLPLALRQLRALVTATDGAGYNRCLASTAQLLLFFGVLFALGLAL
jgi:1,4-dihydroxy-2-naphthoate polyprenyltransferase